MNLPTGRRGQLAAVGILVVLLILLVEFVMLPLQATYREKQAEIADMQRAVTRYRQLIAQTPQLQALRARDDRAQPLAPVLLGGSNAALAGAELQQRLQTLATTYQVRILSLRVRPAEQDGSFERVSVDARMQGELPGLRNLLFDIEQGEPYLFFDTLSVRTRPQRRRGAAPSGLEARLVVSGLRASANPSGAGAPQTAGVRR
jgi:general secretion pathway protein M